MNQESQTPKEAAGQEPGLTPEERHQLVEEVVSRDIFIDPLIGEDIIKAYRVYHEEPNRIVQVLVASFQSYCRKCIQEAGIVRVKNELSRMLADEAEQKRAEVAEEMFKKVKSDLGLERLIMMLIFKNRYWQWVRFGLKDIFTEQRMMPGNPLNNYLNTRFHLLKEKRDFHTVADLVAFDLTDIVNHFKSEVMKPETRIFKPSQKTA